MPTIGLRRFANQDTLKNISQEFLLELLWPNREFCARKGLELPACGEMDWRHYDKLASILMSPEDIPKDLADALFQIHEMASKQGMDSLLSTAEAHGLALGLADNVTPAEVAIRFWLKHRSLFEAVHSEHHLMRPKSFIYYVTDRNPVPAFTAPGPEVIAAMEKRLDDWFEVKRRGRGCRILVFPSGNEYSFLVRHGEPCRREGTMERGEPSTIFYRPQKHDVLVYDAQRGEIRINCSTKGEREIYRKVFGGCLFGDRNYFPGEAKYTLAPLIENGRAALTCIDVPGLECVRLKEVEIRWGKGIREIQKAPDIFASFETRALRLEQRHNLSRAVFQIKFAGVRKCRSLALAPANRAIYERESDSEFMENWLKKRGFILNNHE